MKAKVIEVKTLSEHTKLTWVIITLVYLVLVTIPTEITKSPVILIAGLAFIFAVLLGVKLYINKK